MKKTFLLFGIAVLFFTACQQTPKPFSVNLEVEEAAAREMFSVLRDAMNTQNIDTLFSLIIEDALIIGSDPTEIQTKEETKNMWVEMSAALKFEFILFDEQPFKMSPDGNSAVAVSQFYMPVMAPNVPLRQVFNLNKVDGKWMVTFWSSSVIPKNEDLPKIVEVLALKE